MKTYTFRKGVAKVWTFRKGVAKVWTFRKGVAKVWTFRKGVAKNNPDNILATPFSKGVNCYFHFCTPANRA